MQPQPFSPTDSLARVLPAGSRVLIQVAHVNREGTSRQMRVVVTDSSGAPWEVTGLVAIALEKRQGKHGIIVRGAGKDMRLELLYALSEHLHGSKLRLRLV